MKVELKGLAIGLVALRRSFVLRRPTCGYRSEDGLGDEDMAGTEFRRCMKRSEA